MRFPGLVGPTYAIQSVNIDCQRCVNLYPQLNELRTQPNGEIGALISVPGKRLFASVGDGPIRGMLATASGSLVVVSGASVYRVDSVGNTTLVGSLATTTGRVGLADNGNQVIIVDGPYGYVIGLVDGTFQTITADGFPGGTNVVFQDGYFIVNSPGTGQFAISALYDGMTWDAADFATAEGSPDDLVTLLSCRRQIWLFGEKTIEVWWNSGDANFPFSRFDGAFIEYGCVAPFTAQVFQNTVIWVGAGSNANGIVWMANGYQPQRISNHAVEYAIQKAGDLSTATAYAYQKNGHLFYVLNLPNSDTSWVYDVSTQQWHERSALVGGLYARDRGECYAWCYGKDLVGDYENGNVYALDDQVYTDNGEVLKRMRRSPHVDANMRRVFHQRFQIDAQMGTPIETGQGSDPQICLRYSDDFGNTWSAERWRSLGKTGMFRNRTYWDRLGQSRTRVYEISVTDPVPVVITGAELETVVGVA